MNLWPNSKTLNDNTYREKQEKIFVTLKSANISWVKHQKWDVKDEFNQN